MSKLKLFWTYFVVCPIVTELCRSEQIDFSSGVSGVPSWADRDRADILVT